MKQRILLTAVFLVLGLSATFLQAQVEAKGHASSDYKTQKVKIEYKLQSMVKNTDGTPMEMEVSVQWYDAKLGKVLPLKSISGDGVNGTVKSGESCTMFWDMNKDYPDYEPERIGVRVYGKMKPKPYYMVVDLSGGPNAKEYPVRASSVLPDLSQNKCRTTELWLRIIPPGKFRMGSPKTELGRFVPDKVSDENQIDITARAEDIDCETLREQSMEEVFFMGIFEITQKQYELVTGKKPSFFKGDDRPVESVSYSEIVKDYKAEGYCIEPGFLKLLSLKTGMKFYFPDGKMWEYCCRAGSETALNSDKNLTTTEGKCPNLDKLGRYWNNRNDGRGGHAEHTRVGSYLPNSWGLYDMHGNVREFCRDYSQNGETLLRGGCWSYFARSCRSASQFYVKSADYKYFNCGFRVMCYIR